MPFGPPMPWQHLITIWLEKGFTASAPDTFYKELNEVSTSGVMDKWAVSIAGLVNFDYAACWATTEDIYYKEATVATTAYKKENQVSEVFEIAVYSTSGQLIKKTKKTEWRKIPFRPTSRALRCN